MCFLNIDDAIEKTLHVSMNFYVITTILTGHRTAIVIFDVKLQQSDFLEALDFHLQNNGGFQLKRLVSNL